MGDKTGIEWTDATWNAVRGCTRVSEGCRNCYAETVAHRFSGEGQPYEGLVNDKGRWNGQVKFVREHLLDPLRWKRPRKVFVNSMSDVFHEGFSFEQIAAQWAVMCAAPHHTFQVLTKRPERMVEFFKWLLADADWTSELLMESLETALGIEGERTPQMERLLYGRPWAPPHAAAHIMLGVSVENQAAADERLPALLWTRAQIVSPLFLSCEPLLGAVDLGAYAKILDWVIVGGESGAHARPMAPEWARSLRDQCAAAQVPFFFKQWGQWAPNDQGGMVRHASKGDAGSLLDGAEHKAWPPSAPAERIDPDEAFKRLHAGLDRIVEAQLVDALRAYIQQ